MKRRELEIDLGVPVIVYSDVEDCGIFAYIYKVGYSHYLQVYL